MLILTGVEKCTILIRGAESWWGCSDSDSDSGFLIDSDSGSGSGSDKNIK